MAKILVVDDDRALIKALKVGLGSLGYEVTPSDTGKDGLYKVVAINPDVIILDLGLPDIDGLDFIKEMRQFSTIPILVLSAAGDEQRKVAALNYGADDYLTKPFGIAELEARIRTTIRHSQSVVINAESVVSAGNLVIDILHKQVQFNNENIFLTTKEFDLLFFLAQNADKICTHEVILKHIWNGSFGTESQYLRVYVYRIRQKLNDSHGQILRSIPGIGYMLVST